MWSKCPYCGADALFDIDEETDSIFYRCCNAFFRKIIRRDDGNKRMDQANL